MSVFQVFGCILQKPSLLSDYKLDPEDFNGEDFHLIIFAGIFNLYTQGIKVLDVFAIDSFLSGYEKQYKIFNDNDGLEYLTNASSMAELDNFEYNYLRVKKFSLLRYYERQGFDTSSIYDPSIVEPKKQEEEQNKFDGYTLDDILGLVELKMVIEPQRQFKGTMKSKGQLAGLGMKELIASYQKAPEIGHPMQSKFMNNLLRGARKNTLYLRSGGTGTGKSRLSYADTCYACVPWFYDLEKGEWIYTGSNTPGLIISTEMDVEELQTILLAFISGVNESHITRNRYEKGELERVNQAAEYFESSPLFIEELPDFDLHDVTGLIKKYHREEGIELVNFDYLHTSIKMLAQISSLSKGMRLREDQVLFMASDALKTCAKELGIHLDTATQLNGEYKDAKEKDQNILRGSKAIADRVDVGYIALAPTKMELEAIKPILQHGIYPTPNMIYHLYKCRKGEITRVKVWLHVNLGNCRVNDLFVTNYDNELIPLEKLTIENIDKTLDEHSIKEKEVVATAEEQSEAAKRFLSF